MFGCMWQFFVVRANKMQQYYIRWRIWATGKRWRRFRFSFDYACVTLIEYGLHSADLFSRISLAPVSWSKFGYCCRSAW